MNARDVLPTRRVDDVTSLPRDTDHDFWQLRPGPAGLDLALRPLGSVGIYYERVDTRLRGRGVSPRDYFTLGLPLPGTRDIRCNGIPAHDHVVALGSRQEAECVVERGGLLSLVLDGTAIRKLFLNEDDAEALRARWAASPSTALRCRPRLARSLATLAHDLLARGCPPGAALEAEDALLSLVGRILLEATLPAPRPLRGRPSDQRRLALAAEDVILASAGRRLSVRDICAVTGASERSIETAFRTQFGTSPIQYIRTVRLARVRRDLLAAPAGTTVTKVAYRHGFWHLSRFAGYYRAMFREAPSATLERRP